MLYGKFADEGETNPMDNPNIYTVQGDKSDGQPKHI